ncbi:MAG: hypothetical protein ACTJHW_16115, partial [Paenalcaligenes sp.]
RDLNLGKVALYQLSYSRIFSFSGKIRIISWFLLFCKCLAGTSKLLHLTDAAPTLLFVWLLDCLVFNQARK